MILRLCKAADSWGKDQCPAVYRTDDPAKLIVQGKSLDATGMAALQDLAVDETAVQIPTETVLRAVGLILAERGRPDLLVEIETCLLGADLTGAAR